MKCKQIEKILILESVDELDLKNQAEFQQHLSDCPECNRFRTELIKTRQMIANLEPPVLPPQIEKTTIELCHSELRQLELVRKPLRELSEPAQIPIPIWACLILMVFLFTAWATPVLKELIQSQLFSVSTFIIFALLFQNIIMLLLAPLLLKHSSSSAIHARYF